MSYAHIKLFFQNLLSPARATRDLSALQTYLMALLIALLFIAYMFPVSLVYGNSKLFDPNISDNALHMSSWWYYAKDEWRLPLLWTNRTDYPVGQNIAFTDSIPLAAIFTKLVLTLFPEFLPPHFHYFGWWLILVFILQAISAAMLMRAMNLRNAFAIFIAVCFAISWPPLHVRYPHTALMMQCILIFSLVFYFFGVNKKLNANVVTFLFISLNLLALLIHPYFLPFTFGAYIAFLIDEVKSYSIKNWIVQIFRLSLLLLLLTSFGFFFGYFAQNSVGGGYGEEFSLDLLSPICGNTKWSKCAYLGNALNARSFEGYNYLGLGLLVLIFVFIFFNIKNMHRIPEVFKKYSGLLLITFGLLIYSITNHIRFADVTIFTFELPHFLAWITGTYRAAGRFFWLIGYLILFATITYFIRKKNLLINFLLIFTLILQIVDNSPQLKLVKTELSTPGKINYNEWEHLLSRVDIVNMYPLWGCENENFKHIDAEYIYQIAAYHGKLINSGYTARNNINCDRGEYLKTKEFDARNLYMIGHRKNFFATNAENSLPISFQKSLNRGECVTRKNSLICLPGSNPDFWRSIELNTYSAKFFENGQFLPGPVQNTQMGKPSKTGFDANLISSNPAVPSWLSFGPSVALPVGKYKFTILYSSAETSDKTVGNWDVVLQQGGAGNEKSLFDGKLNGTSGENKRIEGEFTVSPGQETMPLEIRTYFLAKGDLQLVNTSLFKSN